MMLRLKKTWFKKTKLNTKLKNTVSKNGIPLDTFSFHTSEHFAWGFKKSESNICTPCQYLLKHSYKSNRNSTSTGLALTVRP